MWHEDRADDLSRLPRELAPLLRPGLDGLAREICREVERAVPEFAASNGRPARPSMRPTVQQGLAAFVERIADPAAPLDRLYGVCRMFGQAEAHHGGNLNALHSAFRVAFRVAWHRTTLLAARHDLSAEIVARLAAAYLRYMDELATLATEAYLEATTRSPEELARLRGQLLRLVLDGPELPHRALTELAERARWAVPAEVTPVVTRPEARLIRSAADDDVLVDLDGPVSRLVFPGPVTAARRSMLTAALPRERIVVGLTVPLGDAADSVRWAARALALVEEGVIAGSPVTLCEEHLLTLWLLSDPALIDELARRRLARLEQLPVTKRDALTETLRVWLESWSTAAEVGGRLHVHPQTVRYRLNQLKETLGDQLTDPEARFELELVLRAMRLARAASVPLGRRGRRR